MEGEPGNKEDRSLGLLYRSLDFFLLVSVSLRYRSLVLIGLNHKVCIIGTIFFIKWEIH